MISTRLKKSGERKGNKPRCKFLRGALHLQSPRRTSAAGRRLSSCPPGSAGRISSASARLVRSGSSTRLPGCLFVILLAYLRVSGVTRASRADQPADRPRPASPLPLGRRARKSGRAAQKLLGCRRRRRHRPGAQTGYSTTPRPVPSTLVRATRGPSTTSQSILSDSYPHAEHRHRSSCGL